ncbi:hypothetical protein RDI58_020735 [Solanum bulbocastanum]|uniref:Transposase n=1 Tax=Solanum bulbocastanum TaxID=147425 RepID=A0AAN8T7P0_SOLBU
MPTKKKLQKAFEDYMSILPYDILFSIDLYQTWS